MIVILIFVLALRNAIVAIRQCRAGVPSFVSTELSPFLVLDRGADDLVFTPRSPLKCDNMNYVMRLRSPDGLRENSRLSQC